MLLQILVASIMIARTCRMQLVMPQQSCRMQFVRPQKCSTLLSHEQHVHQSRWPEGRTTLPPPSWAGLAIKTPSKPPGKTQLTQATSSRGKGKIKLYPSHSTFSGVGGLGLRFNGKGGFSKPEPSTSNSLRLMFIVCSWYDVK